LTAGPRITYGVPGNRSGVPGNRYLNNLAALLKATVRLTEAEPLMHRALPILVEFTRRAGRENPHLHVTLGNYRGLLEALGTTPDQVRRRLRELDDSLDADDSFA
jgi:hypothetical protein